MRVKDPLNLDFYQMNETLCRKRRNVFCVQPQRYVLFKEKVDMQTSTLPVRLYVACGHHSLIKESHGHMANAS
jgi:hypothetical protein